MTTIHQNSISNNHSIDDKNHQSTGGNERSVGSRSKQVDENSVQGDYAGTVNISFNAELRLRAYQEQRKCIEPNNNEAERVHSEGIELSNDNNPEKQIELVVQNEEKVLDFPQNVNHMLTEVQNNIVKESDPGYQYLVNVLNNNKATVEDPQQLQEIMRKEQFFLSRRKPFMQNSDFQSYSQVLSQFSNIVERQQYAHQSLL
ncbi:MAG: hypothetical protein IME94_06120 [Proteobacteria bacterium]|nr:hypothetical protein [Pseudomonadota bacterium]